MRTSNLTDDAEVGIPEATTNDNFWGYVTGLLYKYRVRWIEAAAACPVFTALITYYVEGDKGHLLNAEQHRPQRAYAVRGNLYSFYMPWEEIAQKLNTVLHEENVELLPHPPETLSSIVLFSLLNNNYSLPRAHEDPQALKGQFAMTLAQRYPETEKH